MKRIRILCLALALLLALSGCLAVAEESVVQEDFEQAVELDELSLIDEYDEEAVEAPEIQANAGTEEESGSAEGSGEGAETGDTGEGETTEGAVALKALTLPETATIGVGEQLRLQPVPEPADAVYGLSFSGGGDYASVSDDGVVTGLKKNGEQTIVVTADNGVTASIKVSVLAAPKEVTLKASNQHINVGDTVQLTYKLPKNTAGGCTFSVEKNDILTVTPEGLVTALAPGAIKITGETYNGKKSTIKMTVLPPFLITFMNIGRNDGILIRCEGEDAYIDSGMRGQGLQAVKFMKKRDVTHLKYYIGTHGHRDHIGGAPAILAAIKTDKVIVSHSGVKSAIKRFAETSAEKKAVKKVKYKVMKRGKTFKLGSAVFEVLGPVKIVKTSTAAGAENGNSLILKVTYGENTFLLTGDATGSELVDVHKAKPGCLKAQVLKNPHHNGRQDYAIKKVKPKITIISTSKSCLPTSSYVKYIKKKGSKVYITASNKHGHVSIASDGKNLTVTTQK